ncbi:MAG: DNA-directed DNA polymerase II small subunit [Methanomicrobiales archaeon]|jgi:DNA polymerase II small subunit|nr:DNA-directed DNA polymerase II small subunit [Methanomicrobiales archaeon]
MFATSTIIERFLDEKLQVHPDVISYIIEHNDISLIDRIIERVPAECLVASLSHVPGLYPSRDGCRFLGDPEIEVVLGREHTARPVNNVSDYVMYFNNRYKTLSSIIRGRCNAAPIEALLRNDQYMQEECAVIGMVSDLRTTANGHRMVQLEDRTGSINVLFNRSHPGFDEAEKLVYDEIIGVKGTLSQERTLLFSNQLYRPDIPFSYQPYMSDKQGKAALISDIHVGSDTFLEEEWLSFLDWISDSEISYLLIAGDMVDGIGIYPGQEHELMLPNIYEQYDRLGEYLSDLPSRIKIICAPGNHDVVRGAEPQPVIPEQFRRKYCENCTFVENPAVVSVQGVKVLMYHGRSYDDLIGLIPGASYEQPGDIMIEMLKRRHLSPCYGRKTPIAAAAEDRLVIDPVPEVLHTGHVHILGISYYRGVLCINAGTWQSQTAFQKQMNINPTPAKAVVLDLMTLQPSVYDFMKSEPTPEQIAD